MATRPLRTSRTSRLPAPLNAYVLHRYPWSESSLILDVFSRELGRLAVAAKGARRPYSQLRCVLLPFQRVQLTLGRAPTGDESSEVQTLRAAEWAGGAAMLTGAALFSGFYVNELLMKLLARHDAHEALFDAYALTLATLGAGEDLTTEAALRAFELCLLQEIGLLPDLSRVTLTVHEVRASQRYTLWPEAGVCAPRAGAAELDGSTLLALHTALRQGHLFTLQQVCARALPALKSLLRGLLHYHLGASPLRTRQVMMDLQSFAPLPNPDPR
jgi:DNA repair protein RecO (recombination protein O)